MTATDALKMACEASTRITEARIAIGKLTTLMEAQEKIVNLAHVQIDSYLKIVLSMTGNER